MGPLLLPAEAAAENIDESRAWDRPSGWICSALGVLCRQCCWICRIMQNWSNWAYWSDCIEVPTNLGCKLITLGPQLAKPFKRFQTSHPSPIWDCPSNSKRQCRAAVTAFAPSWACQWARYGQERLSEQQLQKGKWRDWGWIYIDNQSSYISQTRFFMIFWTSITPI